MPQHTRMPDPSPNRPPTTGEPSWAVLRDGQIIVSQLTKAAAIFIARAETQANGPGYTIARLTP